MKTNWTTANIPSQVGRRALITGSNSGIGFETALALARKGAELILPARCALRCSVEQSTQQNLTEHFIAGALSPARSAFPNQ